MVRPLYLPVDLFEKDISDLFADYRRHRDRGTKLASIDRSKAMGFNAFS